MAGEAGGSGGTGSHGPSHVNTGVEWIFGLEDRLMTWSADLKLYRVEECSGQEDQGYRATVWVIKPNGECHDQFLDL